MKISRWQCELTYAIYMIVITTLQSKNRLALIFCKSRKTVFFLTWRKMMFRLDNLSLDKAYSWKLIVENQFIFNNFAKKCCKLHMCANKYITSIYIVSMNMAYKIWKNWFKIIFMLFDRLCCVLLEWCFQGFENSIVMYDLALLFIDKFYQ